MSPFHGFLHETTDYPSLVYDLIEPYRYIIDTSVKNAYREVGCTNETRLTTNSIEKLKDVLNEEIFCVQTKQLIRRQQLLHGICLSLRAYFLGLGKRFIVPTEGTSRQGRNVKTNFVIPGKSAGLSKIQMTKTEMISKIW